MAINNKEILKRWSKSNEVKVFLNINGDSIEDIENLEDLEELDSKQDEVETDVFSNYLRDVEKINLYDKSEEVEMFNEMYGSC